MYGTFLCQKLSCQTFASSLIAGVFLPFPLPAKEEMSKGATVSYTESCETASGILSQTLGFPLSNIDPDGAVRPLPPP